MSILNTEFGPVFFEVLGEGSPVLVVPGGPGSSHSKFAQLEVNHQVVYFDPLGTGKSARLSDKKLYMVALYAEVMLRLLDHLGPETAHVIGRSFGGVPAAEFAARFPNRVRSLVLANAQVDAEGWQLGNLDAMNEHVRQQYPDVWEAILTLRAAGVKSSHAQYQSLLDEPTNRMRWAGLEPIPMPSGSSFDEDTYLAFTGDDPEWKLAGTLERYTVLDRLVSHAIPTLVLTGRRDLMASPMIAKRTADALQPQHTTLITLERSGHFPMVEEPETYFALLEDFWSRVDA
jgi:proline iminopeptidase